MNDLTRAPPCSMPADVRKEDYYHGLLPRLDTEDLLLSVGDCVVRLSHEPNSASLLSDRHFILSVCVEPGSSKVHWRRPGFEALPKIVKHVLIHCTPEGKYCIGRDYFECIPSMIAYYTTAPIINKNIHSHPLFLTPIVRQQWELEADEVAIGRVMRSGRTREIHFGTLHAHSKAEIDVTIKVIKVHEQRKEAVKEMMHEVRCLLSCRSPFVMRLHGAVVLTEPCLMAMEQASEFLSSFLERNASLSEAGKLDICYQCSLSIAYVHSLDFVVRNIAARNFYCCAGAKVKFGDFSLARRLQLETEAPPSTAVASKPRRAPSSSPSKSVSSKSAKSVTNSTTTTSAGISTTPPSKSMTSSASTTAPSSFTISEREKRKKACNYPSFRDTTSIPLPIRWRAPECLQYASYSQKSDVWAFGVLCWEIYHAGRMPLPGMNSGEVQHFILTGQHLVFEAIAPRVKDYIIDKIFAENPDDRYVMEESAKMLEFFLGLEGKKSSQEKTDSKEKVVGGNSKEKDNSKEKEKG